MYYVIGLEPFKMGQVHGIHSSKKSAVSQADFLEKNKNKHCCQEYKAITATDVKKQKIELYI